MAYFNNPILCMLCTVFMYDLRADSSISPRSIHELVCVMEMQCVYCEVETQFYTLFRRNLCFKRLNSFSVQVLWAHHCEGTFRWKWNVGTCFNWQANNITLHYFENTKITCPITEEKQTIVEFWKPYPFTLNKQFIYL